MTLGDFEIVCPICRGDLAPAPHGGDPALHCAGCGRDYPVVAGIPDLRVFPDPYIGLEEDRAKAGRVAEKFDDFDFAGLVRYYYSITSVVPPKHAERYTRGLLAAPARAAAALDAWEHDAAATRGRTLLEIGCGTAPLLVSAAARYRSVVGIDIALRWLVVGKKRLAEAGVDVPLVCACAEALPFRDSSFDRVVADSVVELLRDQPRGLAEAQRVLGSGGAMFIATPNRWSLGPDPHIGLWAGGYMPRRVVAAAARLQRAVPPARRLLSAADLVRLLREAGLPPSRVFLPDVPADQRNVLSPALRRLVDVYHAVKHTAIGRRLLHKVGPLLYAVAEKP